VVINQSNYIPWKGYFDLIHDADLFVFLDDVQYTKNDWRNRNRLKGVNGTFWLTIPVGGSVTQTIDEVALPDGGWRQKHWKTVDQTYGKAPHYLRYRDFFRHVYHEGQWRTLSELNQFIIRTIAREFLGITTPFALSTEYGHRSANKERVLDILKSTGASHYISGPAAKAYLEPHLFANAGIELIWKNYSNYPEYPQLAPPFTPDVSIIDLLCNVGPAAPDFIWGWR